MGSGHKYKSFGRAFWSADLADYADRARRNGNGASPGEERFCQQI